jgi:hypothetical protein
MPIRAFLEGRKFDPETIRMLGIVFEMTLATLKLADKDFANAVVARVGLLHLRKRASATTSGGRVAGVGRRDHAVILRGVDALIPPAPNACAINSGTRRPALRCPFGI